MSGEDLDYYEDPREVMAPPIPPGIKEFIDVHHMEDMANERTKNNDLSDEVHTSESPYRQVCILVFIFIVINLSSTFFSKCLKFKGLDATSACSGPDTI